jgi:type I restriction enzyme R subunit
MATPEAQARMLIDRQLAAAGWEVQDYSSMNLYAGRGVAVREFPLKTGWADYLLLVDGKAIGAIEAKKAGTTLSGVHHQSLKYSEGLPDLPQAWHKPLPFLYESTGYETRFTNTLDPDPRSRAVFAFHRPETMAEWMEQLPTLRYRLQRVMPALATEGLWAPQIEAINGLEESLAADRPRALIQMATGSGKTFTAITSIYRLIKYGNARRALFLVDRRNLGQQALMAFQDYTTPEGGRKFGELYNVRLLSSSDVGDNDVTITTIQRLYSILKGEELDEELETQSMDELEGEFGDQLRAVTYDEAVPIEFFDVIFIDECHRSIYNLWRPVLEYFDAFLIGLTATPSKQTFGFFHQNLVMEYPRQRAVADGINVDNTVYRIRTRITETGSSIEAGTVVEHRDRLTRQQRWEQLDQDLTYGANQLDVDVVSESQIRTIVRAFRDQLFSEIFPGRKEVPKTLIFAKDDHHAENIQRIVKEEFGRGNEFCQKITYKVTGVSTDELIASFRNSYNPRIAVTVDMIATGTDIKPVEIVMFMRPVKSPNLFEQMLGRGTRVIRPDDLRKVTPDAPYKDHFVLIDTVGVVEHPRVDTQSLDRNPSIAFEKLLDMIALGDTSAETLSTLAGRLTRLGRKAVAEDAAAIERASGGRSVSELVNEILDAVDPDEGSDEARTQAAMRYAANPELRGTLIRIHQRSEVVIDDVSVDRVQEARFDYEVDSAAKGMVESFRQFLEENRDEITALQIIYSRPHGRQRLLYEQVKELSEAIRQAQPNWTTEGLWNAYARLSGHNERASGVRVLTDLISLVRCVVQLDDELVPYPELVQRRYEEWLAAQEAAGRTFTAEQRRWLDEIAKHIGVNLAFRDVDFNDYFYAEGGLVAARRIFSGQLHAILGELNDALTT